MSWLLLLLAALPALPAFAADWYVSPSGSDANPGTSQAAPFQTLAAGDTAARPGDTVFIMDGVYRNLSFATSRTNNNPAAFTITNSGDAVSGPITYRNLPGHTPEIEFDGRAGILLQSGVDHIVIQGLEIQGPASVITYNEAIGVRQNANEFYTGRGILGSGPHQHITVRECFVHDAPAAGIRFARSDHMTIEDCRVEHSAYWSPAAESAIMLAQAEPADASTAVKMIVRRNIVANNWNRIPFFNTTGTPLGSPAFPDYGDATQDYVIDGHGIHATLSQPGYTGSFLIENNLCINNGQNGIHFDGSPDARAIIRNNTLYFNGAFNVIQNNHPGPNNVAGIAINHVGGASVANNIIVNRTTNDDALLNLDASPAAYTSNLVLDGGLTPTIPTNTVIFADPQLANPSTSGFVPLDFAPVFGSPAINNADIVQVATNDFRAIARSFGGPPDIGAFEHVNLPPTWVTDPFTQAVATEDAPYMTVVDFRASDPDNDGLTYALLSGPAWLTLTDPATGQFDGTPMQTHIGTNDFQVSVSDGTNAPVTATMRILVMNSNDAPRFTQPILQGTSVIAGATFNGTLATSVSDDDGDPLTFALLGGTTWLNVATNGVLSGTPNNSYIGTNSFSVRVTDPSGGVGSAILRIEVLTNVPPSLSTNPLPLTATEDAPFSADLAPFATDPEGRPVTFTLANPGASWLGITTLGVVTGTPRQVHNGINTFGLFISDGINPPVPGQLRIDVMPVNDPPAFNANPITIGPVPSGGTFSGSVAVAAMDEEGDPFTFTVGTNAPPWFTITPAGGVSGTPSPADAGTNTITLTITDAAGRSDSTTLLLLVLQPPNRPPFWESNLINISPAFEGTIFATQLTARVTEPDNDPLTFTLIAGPSWLTLTPQGLLAGTPPQTSAGTTFLQVTASDGMSAPAAANLQLNVLPENAPPAFGTNLLFLGTITEGTTATGTIANAAIDPDGDPVTYGKVSGPAWLVVNPDGTVTATPGTPTGQVDFIISATDPFRATGTTTLRVFVEPSCTNTNLLAPLQPVILDAMPTTNDQFEILVGNLRSNLLYRFEAEFDLDNATWGAIGQLPLDTAGAFTIPTPSGTPFLVEVLDPVDPTSGEARIGLPLFNTQPVFYRLVLPSACPPE